MSYNEVDTNIISYYNTDHILSNKISIEHLLELLTMHADVRVMATLGGVRDEQSTRDFLARQLDHWKQYGYGLWMLHDAHDGRFVGRAGIRHITIDYRDEVEIAYALMSEFWGRGLATEVGHKLVAIAFEYLGLPDLIAFTTPDNHASRRVMAKLGLAYERDFLWADSPHVLYRLKNPNGPAPP